MPAASGQCCKSPPAAMVVVLTMIGSPPVEMTKSRSPEPPQLRLTLLAYQAPSFGNPFGPSSRYATLWALLPRLRISISNSRW